MKRTIVLTMLVALFTLAFAGVAFAVAGNSTYTSWVTTPGDSPHRAYTTSSVKCAVCHAVHNASAVGSEVLLKTSIGNACTYCHVGASATYLKVYNSVTASYTNDTIYNHANPSNAYVANTSVRCTDCHSVHSGNTIGNGAGILKRATEYSGTNESAPSASGPGTYDPTTPTATVELAKWCSGCHAYYNTGHNGTTHIMGNGNIAYNNPASQVTTSVAYSNAAACTDCHNGNDELKGFPHDTSTYAGSTNGLNNAPRFISDGRVGTNASGAQAVNNDGVCIRCHISGAYGVSNTF